LSSDLEAQSLKLTGTVLVQVQDEVGTVISQALDGLGQETDGSVHSALREQGRAFALRQSLSGSYR
jgi:hypothetical protein